MVKRNPHVAKLHGNYLFPEIQRHSKAFVKANPQASLIHLGIGDTTEPLPSFITNRLVHAAKQLGTEEGYTGYGPEEGHYSLRKAIAETVYHNKFQPEEIFISDGTNSDIGRLQILFGTDLRLGVQDPSYPVYIDTGIIMGQSHGFDSSSQKYKNISYMSCNPSNHFFPTLSEVNPPDLFYFCSPNNPTGAVATFSQLRELVQFAKKHRIIIVFDTAYASYIQDPTLPRSIYDIEEAKEVAIELGSFSKMAGFTGVRLGWSVVPFALQFDDGHSIHRDWNRVHSTFFNGASNIAQAGGLAILEKEGQQEIQKLIRYYMDNGALIQKTFEDLGYEVYGGKNAPYVWVRFPKKKSWETFLFLLEKAHVVTTPGSGFGPSGEEFIRISSFGKRKNIEEAAHRLHHLLSH